MAALAADTIFSIINCMKAKHRRTLELIFSRPTPAGVRCGPVDRTRRGNHRAGGSRVAVFLFGQIKVMHRPHSSPDMDKGAVASIRTWLEENGVKP